MLGDRFASCENIGRDPFNQNSDRSDREKRTTSKGGPVFSKLFRLDRTDPLSLGPKFPEFWLNGSRPSFLGPRPRLSSLLPSLKREREFCVFTPPTQRHRLKFLDVAAR